MLRRASVKGQDGSHRLNDCVDVLRYWDGASLYIQLFLSIFSIFGHILHPVHTKGHILLHHHHLRSS